MINRFISRFKALFSDFVRKCIPLHKKDKKRPKKVTKVIELEAFGCIPAPSADCINVKGCQTVR